MIFLKKTMPLIISASLTAGLTGCASNDTSEYDLVSMKTGADVENVSADKSARFNVDSADESGATMADDEMAMSDQDSQQGAQQGAQQDVMPTWETMTKTVYFEFDSDKVDREAMRKLETIPEMDGLSDMAVDVEVVGYTDAIGDEAYNKDLSQRRAESVKQALSKVVEGAALNINTEGMGEADSADLSNDAYARKMNRRVEVTITPAKSNNSDLSREVADY